MPGVPGNPAFIAADVFALSSPPEHRARNGGGGAPLPADSVTAMDLNAPSEASANVKAHGAVCGGDQHHHMTALLRSPLATTVLPKPKNSLEWLQNLRQARAGTGLGKDKGPGTPRTSRSSSVSSLASPSRLSALVSAGAGDRGAVCHLRSEAMVRGAVGLCPAPDCPGVGDCVPGATPGMLVYEVKFKRATRTFLLGETLRDEDVSCGDLMKVRSTVGGLCGVCVCIYDTWYAALRVAVDLINPFRLAPTFLGDNSTWNYCGIYINTLGGQQRQLSQRDPAEGTRRVDVALKDYS